jgi:myo-inositol 2-dehydrogenase / D-chiro-inositol 1-dehydrogenase
MRIAVVGCGRMGRERVRAAETFGVDEILLLDEDSGRARALASECVRASAVADFPNVFEERPDAIFICTPPFCRGTLENRAIALGIPFFVEKPIAMSATQVQSVLENLRHRDVLNSVGYMNRHRNSVAHAKAILRSRTIISMTAHWIDKKYRVPWWDLMGQSGGPFNDVATHLMDLFQYLCGVEETLHAAARVWEGVESTVVVTFQLYGGGLGTFLYSCEGKDKDIVISIGTTEGVVTLRGWDFELACNTIDGSSPEPESKPIFEKETHRFLKAVSSQDRSLILSDFAEAFKTQVAMDKVTRIIRRSVPA